MPSGPHKSKTANDNPKQFRRDTLQPRGRSLLSNHRYQYIFRKERALKRSAFSLLPTNHHGSCESLIVLDPSTAQPSINRRTVDIQTSEALIKFHRWLITFEFSKAKIEPSRHDRRLTHQEFLEESAEQYIYIYIASSHNTHKILYECTAYNNRDVARDIYDR